jgi:hypothetical protein
MERIGNDLAKRHDIDILCAYRLDDVHQKDDNGPFTEICAEHTAVFSR